MLGLAAKPVEPLPVIEFASRRGYAKYVIEPARDRAGWENAHDQAALEKALTVAKGAARAVRSQKHCCGNNQ
jgi:hypothetical protein